SPSSTRSSVRSSSLTLEPGRRPANCGPTQSRRRRSPITKAIVSAPLTGFASEAASLPIIHPPNVAATILGHLKFVNGKIAVNDTPLDSSGDVSVCIAPQRIIPFFGHSLSQRLRPRPRVRPDCGGLRAYARHPPPRASQQHMTVVTRFAPSPTGYLHI